MNFQFLRKEWTFYNSIINIKGNIIGAVNFVVVDKTNKGYGIFITNMLEEAEN